ncbi:hypothetical protein V1264_019670 [Littorina saxatilis]
MQADLLFLKQDMDFVCQGLTQAAKKKTTRPARSTRGQSLPKAAGERDTPGMFPARSHGRHVRSDDINALEGVVAQTNQRVSEMGAQLEALKNAGIQRDLAIVQAASTTFVRWGRSTCPNSTQLVYTGGVGGAYWDQTGSSNSVLCLPNNPVHGHSFARPSEYVSELYGAEWNTHAYNQDPVCSVCLTQGRSASVMIPATTVCPGGWALDYNGYLMGSYPIDPVGHDFVCMDTAMEHRPGSEGSDHGLRLFYTYTHCGRLPCPPYTDNTLVACVVCSK